jgi:hypothetical protein
MSNPDQKPNRRPVPASLTAAQREVVDFANAHLRRASMPTYSDMARGLQELCGWLKAQNMAPLSQRGVDQMNAAIALADKILIGEPDAQLDDRYIGLRVLLASRGNPMHGEDPEMPMWGCPSDEYVPVATLEQASQQVRAYIERYALGSGNWAGGSVREGFGTGLEVATVAYNGRVFAPKSEQVLWEDAPMPERERG